MNNLDYGVIGNCKSAALVSKDGSIDWCCLPDFDSSSFFAKILDQERGGCFAIEPVGDYKVTQNYIPRTNILTTTYTHGQTKFEVNDFMPRFQNTQGQYHCPPEIIRYIRVLKGRPEIRVIYDPRPAYAQYEASKTLTEHYLKHYTTEGPYESVYLYSDLELSDIADSRPVLLEDDCFMAVCYNQKLYKPDLDWVVLEFERTKVYWMGWLAKTTVMSGYQKEIERSSLVLKMLASQKTGAILAAVTTSLPETIGEVRNWDYRFCWIRDASMTINILVRLGHYNVAKRFLNFILDIVPFKDERVQIMYPVNHRRSMEEKVLPWLGGYENSRPVRIGNAAALQKQNDIYGVLLDAIYQSLQFFHDTMDNKEDVWTVVRTLARHVEHNWQELDSGIWEFRTEQKHFVFSKILCWAAMDRAARIAAFFEKRNEAREYSKFRDNIRQDILENGCDPETGALVQHYGSEALDASNLLAQQYGFLSSKDPIFEKTVLQTYDRLCKDGLMYRYKTPDDFGEPKSSFTVCTFWMIKSLYLIGHKEQAVEMFEKLLSYSNHLGLFSEDIDFASKRLLGNFPQGYSHIALIDTALTISNSPSWFIEAEDFRP